MNAQFTIGADPEIFVRKNGKAASAHGLVPGTKESPFPTSTGAVQVDGMALEFNINPVQIPNGLAPARDPLAFGQFNNNIVKVLADMKAMVPGYSFNVSPVQEFGEEFLASQPDEAKELGCIPDYSAYTLEPNPTPDGDRPFRTGAGHIHVGWGQDIPVDNEEHLEICASFVKTLDRTLGMFMAFIDREPRRRELYGKAGAFRPKPYGVEYRTPSNVWIKNKDRRFLVYYFTKRAIQILSAGQTVSEAEQENFRRIIDEGNYAEAGKIVDSHVRYSSSAHAAWEKVKAEKEFATDEQ